MSEIHKSFFLGANSPQGFVSRFDQLRPKNQPWDTFILKGGPGTGKSSLMKSVAARLATYSTNVDYIHCSADTDSLDAIIMNDLHISIADGTSPHTLEPQYAGLGEHFVVLNDAIDSSILANYEQEIKDISAKKSTCHSQCCKLLSASASLVSDTYQIAHAHTDISKISTFAKNFCARECKPVSKSAGKESIRFLSGFTNQGSFVFEDTLTLLCDEIIFVDDDFGSVCTPLLAEIKNISLENGYDVISCYCPLYPFHKLDYLILPEKRMGFVCMNKIHNLKLLPHRIIHSQRFCDVEQLKEYKNRMKFNKKASIQLIERGCCLLADAKEHHKSLETYYGLATNYTQVEEITQKLLQRLES